MLFAESPFQQQTANCAQSATIDRNKVDRSTVDCMCQNNPFLFVPEELGTTRGWPNLDGLCSLTPILRPQKLVQQPGIAPTATVNAQLVSTTTVNKNNLLISQLSVHHLIGASLHWSVHQQSTCSSVNKCVHHLFSALHFT
uniref:Uncharacterized protein n=2 Tax=Meloidogyne TaxID=189290 RepID=A0A6V7WQW5_MELEN|nr:unnamed protein product [Meloidogyne enterolobii]